MFFFLIVLQAAYAQHCWYSGFGKGSGVSVKQNFIWKTIPSCPFYPFSCNQAFASQCYATNGGGNVNGYFGMQQSSKGTVAIFSLWDYSSTEKTSKGLNSQCSRFGGEGEGSHCIIRYDIKPGVKYELEVYVSAHDSTGTTFTGIVTNTQTGARSTIGNIHSARPSSGQIATTVSVAGTNSFLEYFAGGNFLTEVGMIGPYIDYTYGPSSAVSDCNGSPPSSVTACIPGQNCGRPNAFFQKGGSIQKQCGNMWNGNDFNSTAPMIKRRFAPIYKAMGEEVYKNAIFVNSTTI